MRFRHAFVEQWQTSSAMQRAAFPGFAYRSRHTGTGSGSNTDYFYTRDHLGTDPQTECWEGYETPKEDRVLAGFKVSKSKTGWGSGSPTSVSVAFSRWVEVGVSVDFGEIVRGIVEEPIGPPRREFNQ